MSKRPEPPSPSTSSLTGSAPKKQQMNSNFFNKPSASSSSSTSNGGKKLDPRFREQPKLPSKTTKGACHVIYGDWKASSKIAAFDLDGTVIKTRSGVKFAKGATDWIYWNSSVAGALKELVQKGFAIVFISNQAGLPHVQKAFVEKLALIGSDLNSHGVGVPFRAFGAFDYDQYRKPCVGTWEKFVREFNDGIPIDYDESFFCGDAAGRPRNINREADHSDCDRKMAYNVGLKFSTPEEYFLKQSIDKNWSWDSNIWNPSTYDHNVPIFSPTNTPLIPKGSNKKQEVIFLIGPPAVGKTFFFNQYFSPAGYISINPDQTTRSQALASLKSHLESSKTQSLILDSRFPTAISRSHYLNLIKSDFPLVQIRALHFKSLIELCKHNSFYRSLGGSSLLSAINRIEAERGVVKEEEFMDYLGSEKIPSESEGFNEIKNIQFSFQGSEEEKRKWSRWLWAGKKIKVGGGGGSSGFRR